MFVFLIYTATLGVWFTIGNIKLSNPNHRRFVVWGGTMVGVEQLVAWHVVKQMEAQEVLCPTPLPSRQDGRCKNTCPGWAYPTLSLPDTCSEYDTPVSVFDLALSPGSALALIPTPPEVCTVDDAPIPGTDLILFPTPPEVCTVDDAPIPGTDLILFPTSPEVCTIDEAPIPGTDLILYPFFDNHFHPYMPALSVAPYNHNSLLPAAIPAVHAQTSSQNLAPFSTSMALCLTCLSGFVLLFLFSIKFGAIIASLLKGHRTLNKDAEHSEYHGEVFIWTQSPAGCSVTVVPKFDAFEFVDSTHDTEDPIDDIAAFQFSVDSDNSTYGVHDLYSNADDTPTTPVLPSLIEVPDVHEAYEDTLAAKISRVSCMIQPKEITLDIPGVIWDNNLTHDVPYWENQSFVDSFREEMNEFLYPDPPLPDSL